MNNINDKSQHIGDNSNNNNQFNIENIYLENQQSLSNEVKTIIDLITYISTNTELQEGDLDDIMPDPEQKIFKRFSDYCNEINNEIVDSAMYSTAQKEAKNVVGIDKIIVGKITSYLKRESRRMLRENNNNPMTALDKLTDYFENILKSIRDNHFDRNAIRYYLIGEIPKCNVFPNENNE